MRPPPAPLAAPTDLLIVGCGQAGLYAAFYEAQGRPRAKVAHRAQMLEVIWVGRNVKV